MFEKLFKGHSKKENTPPVEENNEKKATQETPKKESNLEKYSKKVVAATGWAEQEAKEKMKKAKSEFGIRYKDYANLKFYNIPEEKQKEQYEIIIRKREMDKKKCIDNTVEATGWDREYAEAQIKLAKKLTGTTYRHYTLFKLYQVPENELVDAYNERFAKRKQDRQVKREHYIEQVMNASGWDRALVVEKMKKAWKEVGASAEMFAVYKFWEVPEEEWCTYFTKGDVNALRDKYNKDQDIIKLFMNKDLFCNKFDKFMGRPWCISENLTYDVFCEKFGKIGKVIYKPTTRSGGKGIEVFDFDDSNIKETYEKIKALPDGLIEGFFKQHPDMQKFSLKSVNTIRVGTIVSYDNVPGVENGKVNIVYAGLRMGCGEKYVDNLHSGGIMTDIDLDTGVIVTDGVDFDNNVYTEHPDTGAKIKGFKIPYFDKLKEMIEEAAAGIEGYYGWDVAIGENGPVIIEVNTNAGPTALQAPYVPLKKGMRYRIEKYL